MARDSSPVISVGGLSYSLSLDTKVAVLSQSLVPKLSRFGQDFIPTTAVEWTESQFCPKDLEVTCQRFSSLDDVWSSGFLSCESSQ